jgi:hypothetical protein
MQRAGRDALDARDERRPTARPEIVLPDAEPERRRA